MVNHNIGYFISSRILPWLLLVLGVAAIILLVMAKRLVDYQLAEIHEQKVNVFYKNYKDSLSSIHHQVQNISRNDLVINSLVDPDDRANYIPLFLRSFLFSGIDTSNILVVDFDANVIASNDIPIPHLDEFDRNWKVPVLEEGKSYVHIDHQGLFIAEPIVFASGPEGAVVVEISIEQLQSTFAYTVGHDFLLMLDSREQVIYSPDTTTIPLGSKYYPSLTKNMYFLSKNVDDDFLVLSMESNQSAYQKIVFLMAFIIVSVVVVALFCFFFVFMSSRLLSKTMHRFMRVLRDVEKNEEEGDSLSNYPREFVEISQEFFVMSRDLKDSKKIRKSIQSILNSLNEYLVVFDENKDVILTNNNFNQLIEVLSECDFDDNIFQKIIPEKRRNDAINMDSHLDDFEVEYKFLIKNATSKVVHIIRWSRSLYYSESGVLEGVIFVGTDITQEKQTKQDLYLRNRAVEEASNSIVIADANKPGQPLIYANNAFFEMTGYAREEVIGKNCLFLQGENTDSKKISRIYEAILKREKISEVVVNYRKNGEEFHNQIMLTPITDGDDVMTHILVVQIDVTDRVRINQDLRNAKERAEDSAKMKSEFLASMSHEIRTPMNGVLGMLGLLKRSHLNDQQYHYANLAHSSADSLLTIINDILDFSKIEAGKLELEVIEFDIVGMFSDFMETLAPRAGEKNIELILDLHAIRHCVVRGDPGRIRQVLTNLVGNALKFTKDGHISVAADIVNCGDGVTELQCSVQDTGIGIPQDKMAKLFDSFSQVDTSTTREFGGTGLGLAIVKQLCELMDGGVSVASHVDEGSCFSFRVKLHAAEAPVSDEVLLLDKGAAILVVDANPMSSRVAAAQLSAWGGEVSEQHSIQHSQLDTIAASNYAMIVIDKSVNNECGLVEVMRSDRRFDGTHIILTLPAGINYRESDYLHAGFSAVFPKPITPKTLESMLTHLDQCVSVLAREVVENLTVDESTPVKQRSDVKILLVEDNVINQQVALGLLEGIGYSVDLANNGVEALEALNDTYYDLILMDCQMPEMDGYDATRAIRSGNAPNPDIPIIAMTANAMKGDKEKCLQAGMSDYLSKPIDPDKLQRVLQYHLAVECVARLSDYSTSDDAYGDHQRSEKEIVWDEDAFMGRVLNNNTIADKLIDLFKADAPVAIQQLEQASESDEMDQIRLAAHKLKGSASNLGGIALAGLMAKIEKAGKDENREEVCALLPELIPQYQRLISTIDECRDRE